MQVPSRRRAGDGPGSAAVMYLTACAIRAIVPDMSNHEEFAVPVPPPPFPPPHPRDVIFIRSEDEAEPREHEDIMIRRVPREMAMRLRAAAGGRAMTHAQYLSSLIALHARIRALADAGDEDLRRELEALGLTTVTV